jgi:hypothetical protein
VVVGADEADVRERNDDRRSRHLERDTLYADAANSLPGPGRSFDRERLDLDVGGASFLAGIPQHLGGGGRHLA